LALGLPAASPDGDAVFRFASGWCLNLQPIPTRQGAFTPAEVYVVWRHVAKGIVAPVRTAAMARERSSGERAGILAA